MRMRTRGLLIALCALLPCVVHGHGHMSKPTPRKPLWLPAYDDGAFTSADATYRLDEPVYKLAGPTQMSYHTYSTNAFRCRESRPEAPVQTLVAGQALTVEWTNSAVHPGDCYLYVSYDDNKDEPEHFIKLAEFPGCVDQAVYEQGFDGLNPPVFNSWTVELPSWLASCDHCVLRWEWASVQQVVDIEFFATCADVTIVGTAEPVAEFLGKVSPITAISSPFGHLPSTTAACTEPGTRTCYRRAYNGQFGVEWLNGPVVATYAGESGPVQNPPPEEDGSTLPLSMPPSPPAKPPPPSPPPPSPPPSPSDGAPANPACPTSFAFIDTGSYYGGFTGEIALDPWVPSLEVTLDFSGTDATVNNFWNAQLVSSEGQVYHLMTASYASTAIGFSASGTSQAPTATCTGSGPAPLPAADASPAPPPSPPPSPSPSLPPSPPPSLPPSPPPSPPQDTQCTAAEVQAIRKETAGSAAATAAIAGAVSFVLGVAAGFALFAARSKRISHGRTAQETAVVLQN